MSRRLSMIPPALLLGACLVVLPACKKKPTDEGGGGGGDPAIGAAPVGPPPAVSSDYLLFAQFRAKDFRDSTLFAEIKQAVAKAGGTAEWDKLETESAENIGVKWTDIESGTIVIPDMPAKGEPKMVGIVTASKAFNKAAILKKEEVTTPDSNGFYKIKPSLWLHFPDDKTLVVVSPELAPKYLDGYAKNRSGWPMTSELTSAASKHAVFAVANLQKVPSEMREGIGGPQYSALVAAQKLVVTANLRGKELSVGLRGTYASADAANKAKDQAQQAINMAAVVVDTFSNDPKAAEMPALKPAITEAQRAVKATKIEVSGPDLTFAASYKADFDIPPMVTEVMKKIKGTGERISATNNLRQIGLALHNYESTYQRIPVHGVGANGAPLARPTDKPLLSWRVAILPYIEQDSLYKEFRHNEPWDSEHNKKLIPKMPKIFAPVDKPGRPGYTHLQMVIGPNAMQVPGGPLVPSIPDGTSNTIAVVEAADAVEWTKPADVVLPAKLAPGELKRKFGGVTPGGFNAVMWDGLPLFVKDSVTERDLALALNPRDGMVLAPDWNSPTSRK
jgi:hypothetical protein